MRGNFLGLLLLFGALSIGDAFAAPPAPVVPAEVRGESAANPATDVEGETGLPPSDPATSYQTTEAPAGQFGFNAKLHPVVLLIGMISLDVDYKLAERFTLGAVGSYLNRDVFGVKFQGSFVGARGTYSFDQAYTSGAYLAAQLEKGRLELSTPDFLGRKAGVTSDPTNFSIIFGYQWFGERMNFNLGVGYLKSDIGNIAIRDLDGKVVQEVSLPFPPVTGELALGVTF